MTVCRGGWHGSAPTADLWILACRIRSRRSGPIARAERLAGNPCDPLRSLVPFLVRRSRVPFLVMRLAA